ncbi:MAG TPA: hypothetical protein EYM35_09085, partial [Rhodospirillales bacterium]|nr:hypothetical protein [Rhodospirillales bacterium]
MQRFVFLAVLAALFLRHFLLARASGRLQGCHSAGKALQKAGKFAEAIPYFEQAVDYGEGRFGDGHPKLAKALEWLANAHRQA